jgi:hypothetical protein
VGALLEFTSERGLVIAAPQECAKALAADGPGLSVAGDEDIGKCGADSGVKQAVTPHQVVERIGCRLAADAGPFLAALERGKREWEDLLPARAEDHLLRIIAVFRYGDPRIDEPLADAYSRALSKLGTNDAAAPSHVRGILETEPPAGDIKSKISSRIQELPDWLLYFCFANVSMNLLGIHRQRLSESVLELKLAKSDQNVWPNLPQGVLERRHDQSNRSYFNMSWGRNQRFATARRPEPG